MEHSRRSSRRLQNRSPEMVNMFTFATFVEALSKQFHETFCVVVEIWHTEAVITSGSAPTLSDAVDYVADPQISIQLHTNLIPCPHPEDRRWQEIVFLKSYTGFFHRRFCTNNLSW